MNMPIRVKIEERIQQLIEKGMSVKATHKPNSPGVIGFPTLETDAFFEWKTSAENLIARTAGESSSYYKNFLNHVKKGDRSHVDAGVGILKALNEDLQMGLLERFKDLVFDLTPKLVTLASRVRLLIQ